jgi:hypothetical protein
LLFYAKWQLEADQQICKLYLIGFDNFYPFRMPHRSKN